MELFKMLYTSPPGRPVHSNTNSTSLGSIQWKWRKQMFKAKQDMVFGLCIYKSYSNITICNYKLRISHQWFTRKTLLNTHLNFMGYAILLDNTTS